jgi:hypothetical protein
MQNTKTKKVKMQLVGLDGNAFVIMGTWRSNALRQGWSQEEVRAILEEAQSGDYDHLLATIAMNTTEPDDWDDDDDDDEDDDEDNEDGDEDFDDEDEDGNQVDLSR